MGPPQKFARRAPIQARGVRRVDAILDAANELLAEVGYDALTLTTVADRSGSNIASLYRFFTNKEQLIDALADRIAFRLRGVAGTVLDVSLATMPIKVFIDNLVDPLAEVAAEYPGLGALMGRIEKRHRAVDAEIAARLEAIVAARAPRIPQDELVTIVRMTMGIVRAGVQLIARVPEHRRQGTIAEFKTVLRSYFEARLGERQRRCT